MTDWTRVPVVIGGGQITNREENPVAAPDPFYLMHEAARGAARSAGGVSSEAADKLLASVTHLYMVHSLSLRHGNPAPVLAERIGAPGALSRCSGMGGSIPQWLVNRAAEQVAAGERPLVLIAGAEALATRRRAKKAGVDLPWPSSEGWPDTWPPLEGDLGVHKAERAHGLDQATTMYALVESALSHAAGHDPDEHRRAMGRLMARCNEVACANPVSWFSQARTPEEIMRVGPDNRMVCHPYPKYVNAVMDVDMGAAVLVTDAATARGLGLGADEVAYVTGWADAHDVWYLSQRPSIERSPALVACGQAATAAAALSMGDVGAFDLYGCFPSSIEVARDSFGISEDDPRPITLTGGLPSHGGPGSNYVTHAIVNTLDHLRAGRSDHVLVHGNGYYLTKHSVGVYGARPPAHAPETDTDWHPRLDASLEELPIIDEPAGSATVVAYTVAYDRVGIPGPAVVVADCQGGRALAQADPELTTALVSEDGVGWAVNVTPGGTDDSGRRRPNRVSATTG